MININKTLLEYECVRQREKAQNAHTHGGEEIVLGIIQAQSPFLVSYLFLVKKFS